MEEVQDNERSWSRELGEPSPRVELCEDDGVLTYFTILVFVDGRIP